MTTAPLFMIYFDTENRIQTGNIQNFAEIGADVNQFHLSVSGL
jgi:hypothetical protein